MAEYGQETPLGGYIESVNLAEKLSKDRLEEIGEEAKRGFEADLASREPWMRAVDESIKLAKQVVERKTWPWPGASNVKYPLLSTASMQFAARAYPSLVPSNGKVVQSRVIGKDPQGEKTRIAEAVGIYMSYQLLEEMDGWEEDMDRMLVMLPIIGVLFKKTYWDPIKKVNCSKLVLPSHLVVNYWARSLKTAPRISEILEINGNTIKERQQAGLWLDGEDMDIGEASMLEIGDLIKEHVSLEQDDTTPRYFVEQHTYLDLDDDGYKEPYVVTFHRLTGKVFRIVARYDDRTIHLNEDGELALIEPIEHYTKFGFIPNPDGSFYDIGFGVLLGPLNESVNTLINQLIDSGTVYHLQSGFIGKGLRLRMGENQFNPGEWKAVNSTGDDLKKQIVPLPSVEPSKTLFDLLTYLVNAGKELASVAEIFTGKMPGQNTPATTTMASIEQGMKVFTAVYKRIYRALGEELKKLYRLNSIYLNPNTYVAVVDMEVQPTDFNLDEYNICPGADPTAVAQSEKLMKAQGLVELVSMGFPLDPVQVLYRVLDAQEQPNWQQLIPPQVLQTGQMPPQPPSPEEMKLQEMQMKGQQEEKKIAMTAAQKQQEMELDRRSEEQKMQMEEQQHAQKMQHEMDMAQVKVAAEQHKTQIFAAQAQAEAMQTIQHNEDTHQQALRQGDEMSKAKVEQTKAQAAAKPKPQPKGGTKK